MYVTLHKTYLKVFTNISDEKYSIEFYDDKCTILIKNQLPLRKLLVY